MHCASSNFTILHFNLYYRPVEQPIERSCMRCYWCILPSELYTTYNSEETMSWHHYNTIPYLSRAVDLFIDGEKEIPQLLSMQRCHDLTSLDYIGPVQKVLLKAAQGTHWCFSRCTARMPAIACTYLGTPEHNTDILEKSKTQRSSTPMANFVNEIWKCSSVLS